MWGSLAAANVYRFSSKEWNGNSGLYYYLYRFYDPNLQRWLNRDPIDQIGGMNLYAFCSNMAENYVDPLGLSSTPFPITRWPSIPEIPPITLAPLAPLAGPSLCIGTVAACTVIAYPLFFPPTSPINYPPTYPGQVNAPPISITVCDVAPSNPNPQPKDPCYFTGKTGLLGCQYTCFDGVGWYTKWFPVGKGYGCKSRVTNP
jgi:RHS repeat-associated protein